MLEQFSFAEPKTACFDESGKVGLIYWGQKVRSTMTKKELLSLTNIFKEDQGMGHHVWWAELPKGWVFHSGAHVQADDTKRAVVDAVRSEVSPCDCKDCRQ